MRKIKEFFPEVKDYYYISENGEVISKARKQTKTLKPGVKKNGYLQVSLVKEDGGILYISIHRLVAICFIPNSNANSVVNHKDGNKKNNSLTNLEWATQKENVKHSWENSLSKPREGERSNLSTITEAEALKIVSLLREGLTDKVISEITGASVRGIIARIRRRETWKHLTHEGEVLGKSQKRK